MSAEQLEWIKTNYTGLWANMDADFRGYLDDIIKYGDTKRILLTLSMNSLQKCHLIAYLIVFEYSHGYGRFLQRTWPITLKNIICERLFSTSMFAKKV